MQVKNSSMFATKALRRALWSVGSIFLGLGSVVCAQTTGASSASSINVWHALPQPQRAVFEDIVQRYNNEYKAQVVLTGYPTLDAVVQATKGAQKNPASLPDLLEISDFYRADFIAQQKNILPIADLMDIDKKDEAQWLISSSTNYVRDAKNKLLGFPYMAEVPVMFYNRDVFKAAGLNPDQPPKTWVELQNALNTIVDTGVTQCTYATSDQSWIHMENLSAIHNQPFTNKDYSVLASGVKINGLLHVKHLALLSAWANGGLLKYHTHNDEADQHFVSGECAVLMSGSSAWAEILNKATFSYGVAPIPYYSDVVKEPYQPFIGGSAFWATKNQDKQRQQALKSFLNYLASPTIAAEWSKRTGYLPLTKEGFKLLEANYYDRIPGAQRLVQSVGQPASIYSRSFSLKNYDQVNQILNQEIDATFAHTKPALQAIDDAVKRIEKLK